MKPVDQQASILEEAEAGERAYYRVLCDPKHGLMVGTLPSKQLTARGELFHQYVQILTQTPGYWPSRTPRLAFMMSCLEGPPILPGAVGGDWDSLEAISQVFDHSLKVIGRYHQMER